MPSIWKALYSYSNTNDNSPPLKGKSKSSSDIFEKSSSSSREQKKKLTRARKLRHATDGELGLNSGGVESLPVSPVSGSGCGSGPRTPGHWSKSAVPLPLPLPEKNIQQTQSDFSHAPAIARNRAPEKSTGDGGIAGKQIINPTYRRRGFPQELNVDTPQNDFHLHFPTRSAPGSGSSSPIIGSQRYSTVELLTPFRPSPEFSSSKSYQISPVHSPTKQGILAVRGDSSNSSSVYPLPRPPVVCRPPPTVRHSLEKSDGSTTKGQWQKGRPIGRGTYGSVYIATHRETGATCALKEVEMVPGDPKFKECVKQLEQEIKLLRDMKHRNIVQYYGCEIIEDRFCIYLEYVHPGSVNKYISEHCGAMTESIVRNFTRHILSGLAYLHSTNTIHRDIKGANLLVDAYGVVKLADFGLAKHLSGNDIELSLKGTPHWMAPELLQAVMRKDANPDLAFGVDIWSVGCTVVEMLTGKPPWSDFTWVQAMFNVLNRSPPIPESLSDEAKDFLQRCFKRRPEERPSAVKLLEHPFVRSSQDHVAASGLVQEFQGMKLHDMESTSDRTRRSSKDVMPISSVVRIQRGKTTHNSPRSTLEAHPRMYLPGINRSSKSATSSPSTVDSNRVRGVSNDVYSFSCKGNLAMVMPKMGESKKQRFEVQQGTK